MPFVSTANTEGAARKYRIKRLLLVLSLSDTHIENGLNTVDGFLEQYSVDDDAFTSEEVQECINDLVAEGVLSEE